MKTRGYPQGRAFTVLELLLVIGIITILATLLLTAVSSALGRVRNFAWEMEGHTIVLDALSRLQDFYSRSNQMPPQVPPLSAEQLHKLGIFSSKMMGGIRSGRVVFFPFSASDPKEKIILKAKYGEQTVLYRKTDILKDPGKEKN